jgi:hypothetical protein
MCDRQLYAKLLGLDRQSFGKPQRIQRFAVNSDAQPFRPWTRTLSIRAARGAVGLAVLVAGAGGLAGYYSLRATSWAVMTDELQVAKLAQSIAERLSPVPYVHGAYYGAISQLYPLLLAPFFGLLSAPSAERAAHALNAVLLPSAAWPAFLLARSVTRSRTAGLAAAALTALTPWLVLTSTLLTENAAYPAFVWAVLLCHRTLAVPSPRRDAVAVAGLLLAFFARTQLLVLGLALPLAVVLHEVAVAVSSGARARAGLRRAVTAHRLLAAAYAVALLVVVTLLSIGSLDLVVGNYSTPFDGDLLPDGVWAAAASHLVHVVVGCGVLPFLLATGWALSALVGGDRREARAFAALFVVLVPLMTIEVASFDLRFTPQAFTQERYLFYVVPLFAVGAAAAFGARREWRMLAVCSSATMAMLTWFVLEFSDYADDTIVFWASPAAAFHTALVAAGAWLHLSAEALVLGAAAALLATALALLRRAPRLGLLGATAFCAAFGVLQFVYVSERYADPWMTRSQRLALPRDWIDRAVPDGQSVALVPSPHDAPEYWWEAEFWNKQADHVLRVNGGPTFSPFAADDVTIDFRRGLLRGSQPSSFLVLSGGETRFHPVETGRVVDDQSLKLVRVERPYLLDWATRNVTPDGWTIAARPAKLRFYGQGNSAIRDIVVVLAAPSQAALPLDFLLRGAGSERRGRIDPGGARPPVNLSVCTPGRGFVDLALTTHAAVRIPDGRLVGVHVDRISVTRAGACVPGQVSSR